MNGYPIELLHQIVMSDTIFFSLEKLKKILTISSEKGTNNLELNISKHVIMAKSKVIPTHIVKKCFFQSKAKN